MAKASDFEGKKPEELFYFVDYSPEEAERIGYSNYSYWGSVIQNFLKQKVAVFCLILFLALTVFSFIALSIGKYHFTSLISDSSKAFIKPNSEYWFGTDNLGRDYWCQVWYATQVSIRLALVVAVGEHRGRDLRPDLGLCAQPGPLLHGAVQPDRQRALYHLYDPDRPDGGPELLDHGHLHDRHQLAFHGTPCPQHGVHVP